MLSRLAATRSRRASVAPVSSGSAQPDGLGPHKIGGGFGGCIVSMLRRDCLENFKQDAFACHARAVRGAADFYVKDHVVGGVRQLTEE